MEPVVPAATSRDNENPVPRWQNGENRECGGIDSPW